MITALFWGVIYVWVKFTLWIITLIIALPILMFLCILLLGAGGGGCCCNSSCW